MPLGPKILSLLNRSYEPDSKIETFWSGNELTFITNKEGQPVLLFLGKKRNNGSVIGERYSRQLIKNRNGEIIKDHWERKGKSR